MRKLLILILSIIFTSNLALAQESRSITLIVNGQGITRDIAQQNALRTAIEQAPREVFLSDNEILGKGSKEENSSISNVFIKDFEVIFENQISNGDYIISLKAIVLISFKPSTFHGKELITEFDGKMLASKIKKQFVSEQNEIESISSIVKKGKEILYHAFDYTLNIGTPKEKSNNNSREWSLPISIKIFFNQGINDFKEFFLNSLREISMPEEEISQYQKFGKKTYKIAVGNGYKYFQEKRNLGYDQLSWERQINSLGLSLGVSNVNDYEFQILELNDRLISSAGNIKELKENINSHFKKNLKRSYDFNANYIRYFKKDEKTIFQFRSEKSIEKIMELMFNIKYLVFNFEVNNGICKFSPTTLFSVLNFNKSTNLDFLSINVYNFRLYEDNLNFILFNNGLFSNEFNRWYNTFDRSLQIFHVDSYDIRNKVEYEGYASKYDFLINSQDNQLEENFDGGYDAVISLFDFKTDNNVFTLVYDNILSLTDLENISKYIITPRSQPKEEEAKIQTEAEKTRNEIGGLFSGNSGSGQTGKPGNQGDPNGDPYAEKLQGISTGSGVVGGGLGIRGVMTIPEIKDKPQKEGTVVVRVCVDQTGKVISAEYTQVGSTTADPVLVKIASDNSRLWKFLPSDSQMQCGTITYKFKLN